MFFEIKRNAHLARKLKKGKHWQANKAKVNADKIVKIKFEVK